MASFSPSLRAGLCREMVGCSLSRPMLLGGVALPQAKKPPPRPAIRAALDVKVSDMSVNGNRNILTYRCCFYYPSFQYLELAAAAAVVDFSSGVGWMFRLVCVEVSVGGEVFFSGADIRALRSYDTDRLERDTGVLMKQCELSGAMTCVREKLLNMKRKIMEKD
ncbi:hypothetical protein ACLOJK_040707 [Asimina triloba]